MSDHSLKIAIVGCGAIAGEMHVPAVLANPHGRLAGLVDADLARARALGEKIGVSRIAARLSELTGEIDAVILATPPHIRPALAVEAFAMGCHVLCEKPMANTAAECAQIIAAANATQKVLAIGHNYRFWPVRQAIKKIIMEGRLGTIQQVEISEGKPYTWQPVTGYTMIKSLVPGGVLLNAGIHTLDALLWWFGRPVAVAYEDDACGGLESNLRLQLEFAGQIKAGYRLSRTCLLDNQIRIQGEQGTVQLSIYGRDRYQFIQNGASSVIDCGEPGSTADLSAQVQLTDFISSIYSGKPPQVDGLAGLAAVQLIEQCYLAKRKRPLPEKAPLPGLTW
ncbi:MAG: Gfo/Idh/MocA family oxidoreductase [Verrucomicrobiota bacterium]